MLRLLTVVCALGICGLTAAQPLNLSVFRHLDQKNGLLHNAVYAIAQDDAGYIWIGSENGLQRYDGIRFVNFQKGIGALSSGIVPANIYTGDKAAVWFTCRELFRLDKSRNTIATFTAAALRSNKQFAFTEYRDGHNRPYFLGDFAYYLPAAESASENKGTIIVPNNTIQTGNPVVRGRPGESWICAGSNLLFDSLRRRVYSTDDNPLQHPLLRFLKASSLEKSMSVLLPDKNGNYWLSTWDGRLVYFESATGRSKTYTVTAIARSTGITDTNSGTSIAICLLQDSRGAIWAGTNHAGLLRFDSSLQTFLPVPAKGAPGDGIDYNYSIHCITEDREGNLWLGTDKGIDIFHPYRQYFQTISARKQDKNALPDFEITSALGLSNGDILVTTWGGGTCLYDSLLRRKAVIHPQGPYQYNMTWDGQEAADGTVWIGAQHGYLYHYYPLKKTWDISRPPALMNSTVRCLAADKTGNVFFGLHNGRIVKWDTNQKRFVSSADSTNQVPVLQLLLHMGKLWATTENGLVETDAASMQVAGRFSPVSTLFPGGINKLHGLCVMNDSLLVTGTKNAGIFFFNTVTKKFFRDPSLAAVDEESVYAIKKSNDSSIWFTTNYSLYHYQVAAKKLLKIKPEEGRINAAFSQCSFRPLKSGRWLTSTDKEVVCFDPRQANLPAPAAIGVLLTGIRVMDKNLPIDSLPGSHQLQLNHQQNFITFYFSDFLYNGIADHVFYHRLTGIDKDWVRSSPEGMANYTSLAPGDYVFELKGDDAAPLTKWNITVQVPFYASWWFLGLAGLMVAFAVFLIIRRRIAGIRRQSELQQRIAEAELSALRAQMNPHFIFNCLSAIDNMIETDQKDKATTYLNRFGRLIRSVLDSSKKNLVPLQGDIETLNLYLQLEQFRCDDQFTYQITVDPELLNGDYKVPPLVVQPFVENAIHHGLLNRESVGHLELSITIAANCLLYCIKDDGIGRLAAAWLAQGNDNDKGHTSYGIAITEERIRKFNGGEIRDPVIITDLFEEGRPTGTLVEVFLKIA